MQRALYSLIATALLLAACRPAAAPQPARLAQPGYVLAGQNVAGGFANNALVIFDPQAMAVERSIALPRSWAQNISRDPAGRLWIGFSGNLQDSDNRVQVYSAHGELLETLRPCVDPEAGISFAAGRAFVACAENGLSGKLAVIDLDTLAIEKTLDLVLPGAPLLLVASAASEQAVVVAGLTSGPRETSYGVVVLVDPHTLEAQPPLPLGENTDTWRILPYGQQFYLLNVASYRQARQAANDVLVLTPGQPPAVEALALAPAPLWGAIEADVLYAYHNPTWNSTLSDPRRQLSRLDLRSGQLQTWELPQEWNASDLAVADGHIVLVKWEYWSGDAHDGLYRFDPDTGSLTLLMNVADASRLVLPH